MVQLGAVFCCESVIQNPDGSPREVVNRFSTWRAESYPFQFGFTVVIKLIFSEAFRHFLTIRINDSNGEIIFGSQHLSIGADKPPEPDHEIGMISTLEPVVFPEPGEYILDVLLDNVVKHKERLSFM